MVNNIFNYGSFIANSTTIIGTPIIDLDDILGDGILGDGGILGGDGILDGGNFLQFLTKPAEWITEQFVSIIKWVVELIFKVISSLIGDLHGIIITLFDIAKDVFESATFLEYFNIFQYIGIGLISVFALYTLIKSIFFPLGFDGDSPLNILISYLTMFVLLKLLIVVIHTFVAITLNLVEIITIPELTLNIASSLTVEDASIFSKDNTTLIEELAIDFLTLGMLIIIFWKLIEFGARIVQRAVLMMVVALLGPILVPVGVIKSQRQIVVGWFKSFIASCLSYFYMILVYTFAMNFLNGADGGFTTIIRTLGFLYAIKKTEEQVQSLIVGEGGVGGYTQGGVSKNIRRTILGW